jgi:hypothetical protein
MALGWNGFLSKPAVKTMLNLQQPRLDGLSDSTQLLLSLNNMPRSSRTPAHYAEIRAAERDLVAQMSDIKMRFLFIPPLTEADFITLGLRPRDRVPTAVNAPVITAEADLTFPTIGRVELWRIRPSGNVPGDARASYGTRIYYGVLGADDGTPARITAPPVTGANLPQSVFTRKNRYCFDFPAERGKHAYFCIRYENSKGQHGPWGTILEAYVP